MMVTAASGRRRTTEDLTGSTQDNSAGGEYCVDGTDTEEIASKRSESNREETEESASEGKAKTTGGAGEVGMTPTPTATAEKFEGSSK